jgi:hypothetical protein
MQKIFKSIDYAMLIPFVLFGILVISSSKDYRKIDKNKIPAFVIQEGKLSKQQIADLTKFSDAKNIWVINDDENYKKATELIKQSADAISYANQIGRLDLVSILLGIIAIIFGFVGIVGFLHIKEVVEAKAQLAINKNEKQLDQKIREIEKDTKEHFKTLAEKYFEDGGEASKIIQRYVAQEIDKNNIEEVEDEQELN